MSQYFSQKELECPCCGQAHMADSFMGKLDALRADYGYPMILTSAFRCSAHNRKIGGAQRSPHLAGRAVDVLVKGERAFDILALAAHYGFTGIGIQQKGDHATRFIHLDDLIDEPGTPRPWVWTY